MEIAAVYSSRDRLVLALRGELDLATAPRVSASIEHVDTRSYDRVDFDLSALEFCDCAGLDALIDVHHRLAAAGCESHICQASRSVRRVLALTHCDWLLVS